MNKQHLIALAVGAAAGFFLAENLTQYAPFNKVFAQGASMAG